MSDNKIKLALVGADPELFLRDRETKEIVSAIGLIPGEKAAPYQIAALAEGHGLQTDNVMVEITVPATNNPTKLFTSIHNCIDFINSIIPSNLECTIEASAILDEKYLQNKKALEFGCEPDFNAWDDGMANRSPKAVNNQLRTAGGHIHVGFNHEGDIQTMFDMVKALDITLGLPSVILDPDKRRKEMYGKVGAFRPKNYGIEYRVLSNFWIKEQELVNFVFSGINKAIELLNGGKINLLSDEEQLQIQSAINLADEKLAYELIDKFGITEVLAKSAIDIY